jgi:hypothetical protein
MKGKTLLERLRLAALFASPLLILIAIPIGGMNPGGAIVAWAFATGLIAFASYLAG